MPKVRISQYYDKDDRCPRWIDVGNYDTNEEAKKVKETLEKLIVDTKDLTRVSILLW